MIALIFLRTKQRRPHIIHTFADLEIPVDTSLLQQLPPDPDCVGVPLELRKLVSCRILPATGDKVPYTGLTLQEENKDFTDCPFSIKTFFYHSLFDFIISLG